MVSVSWYGAAAYCEWLTAPIYAAGEIRGKDEKVRLPTLAEWERAAHQYPRRRLSLEWRLRPVVGQPQRKRSGPDYAGAHVSVWEND